MRSFIVFAVLALSSTTHRVAGSACKPRSSSTIPTLASSTTESISTTTPTNDVALPSVRNIAINGNMAEIDPSDPLNVPDWDVINDAKIVGGQGREEPGSTERGACAMSAANTRLNTRDVGSGVSMSQTMSDLEVGTTYTIRFYYRVFISQGVTNCQLSAQFGNSLLTQDSISSSDVSNAWTQVLQTADAEESTAALKIQMECEGGSATILLDSVFVSNKVTPGNIDQFVVDFGNNGSGANPPLVESPQTTSTEPASSIEPTTTESGPIPGTTTTAVESPFCSKALNGGCWWKGSSVGCESRGSWPGPGGQGRLIPRPDNYPEPLSQLWCVGWCSLSPGCRSAAYNPVDRSCRFSEFAVQDSNFVPGPDAHVDTEGVYYWHDLSCFNCPCNDGDEPEAGSIVTTTSAPAIETTMQTVQPTSPSSPAVRLPPASTCPKSLNDGCTWNAASQGGSLITCQYRGRWPGADGVGYAVEKPRDYPMALSQSWCVAWCSLSPGCRSAAHIPENRSCRFSSHAVHDDDFIMADDPNQDSEELGIYYWHDLSCMDCPCRDEIESATQPSTTLLRSVTSASIESTTTQEPSSVVATIEKPPRPSAAI
ncbi:hypothetical protein FPOAC2_05944 [Fusarium poae]|jgi:hypothetical protein|uniref:CBM-cenC domain-containing protein n=1 Tax=Fusarium poae TaxID=36050 RepID=A0A1B8AWK7_FUSPO|nr:hypothetical protein FPOAC1_005827 [Fusarium poae]KAG8672551.1 hypothetical protein FPOAC1_005827 [Fusarium poae]OBS24754.1 hypothetical protein FPOA_05293 [Fusarium poae]